MAFHRTPTVESTAPASGRRAKAVGHEPRRVVVMLGPSSATKGGISAVINLYRRAGLFDRWPIVHLETHVDGSLGHKFRAAAMAYVRFLALLALGRVALLHVHSASNASFWRKSLFILVAKAFRRPVIFHLHGGGFMGFVGRWSGSWRGRYIRWVLRWVDEIVVLSGVWRRQLSAVVGERELRVVSNPVEAAPLIGIDASARSPHTALFVGRLDPDKGIFDIIHCLPAVRAIVPQAKVLFAGTGDSDGLTRAAAALGVSDAIELLGWVDDEEKRLAMAKASVYLLPSYIECMPMGLLEAMAAGMAVVASEVGGIPDLVVPEVDGLLMRPKDREALTRALVRLFTDPDLCRRLGEAARRKIMRGYTTEQVLPRLEAIYQQLGAGRRAPRL
jgi:glycosyltransferase involved in cell wall biosynthesis